MGQSVSLTLPDASEHVTLEEALLNEEVWNFYLPVVTVQKAEYLLGH